MDIESRKLTAYEKAEVWSQINLSASRIVANERIHQNTAEFYKEMDTLHDLQKKLKWHEAALTIEKGE